MKTYHFYFVASPAEFEGVFVSTVYGARNLANEIKTCTLADAVAYLPAFSEAIAAPNHAYFHVVQGRDERAPSGYKKARRNFDFNPTA